MKQGCQINGVQVRHSWTEKQRIDLAILLRFYENSPGELVKIWSNIHRDQLALEGFPTSGYPLQAMRTHVNMMKRGGLGTDAWNRVARLSMPDARKIHAEQKDNIEQSAQILRIVLRLRLATPPRELSQTRQRAVAKPVNLAIAQADEWSSSSSEENEENDSPCVRHMQTLDSSLIRSFTFDHHQTAFPRTNIQYSTNETGRPIERPLLQKRDSSTPGSPRHPTLLFRAFFQGHGFKARKVLANKTTLPPPPQMASTTFLEMVDPHLREYLPENATYLSPFISLTESPKRALGFIGKKKLPRSLAIFETNAITRDGRQRYGDAVMPYPWLVPSICQKHDLNDLPQGYTGTGEFLVWASIEAKPIATLSNSEALELLGVMDSLSSTHAVGGAIGEILGPCLSSVPDNWKEAVAYKLIRTYKVEGYQKGANGDDYDDFINSIYAVTRGNRAASVFSEYDEIPTPRLRPVVEIPISSSKLDEFKEQIEMEEIVWKKINPRDSRRQISIAVPKDRVKMAEKSDEIQAMIDAQLCSDGYVHGLAINQGSPVGAELAISPNDFLRELQKHASSPVLPPVPPADYSALRFDPSTEDTVVVDLCDEDNEEEADEPRELPQVDLTQEEHIESDQDYEIIASATRDRGGQRALSIRSRSLSTTLSTPCRVEKLGREKSKRVQNR